MTKTVYDGKSSERIWIFSLFAIVFVLLYIILPWITLIMLIFYPKYILMVILFTYPIQLLCHKSDFYYSICMKLKPQLYFRSFRIFEEEEITTSNTLITIHPHGVYTLSVLFSLMVHERLRNSNMCGSRALLFIPILGFQMRWLGIIGVNPQSFKACLSRKENLIFVPGGYEEATVSTFNKNTVFINNRKGFIKYGLQYGYKIQPCFGFNENKLFRYFEAFENFRLILNKWKIPSVIFFSKFIYLPNPNTDLAFVIGKSFQLPLIQNPSNEDIDKWHKYYIKAVIDLYERNKDLANGESLRIM